MLRFVCLPVLLAVTPTLSLAGAAPTVPLRARDQVAVQVIFTYGDAATKSLPNGSSIRFDSERSGAFDATLDRYRAYAGVDSFKLDQAGQGSISVGDTMTMLAGGQAVVRREEGSGVPGDCAVTVHIDSKRGVYSIAFELETKTTVTLTGPGMPPQYTPNATGVAYESGDLPLPAGDDVIRGQALFDPPLGGGHLGTNIVPEGRLLKQQEGGTPNSVHLRWQIGRPGPKPPLELILAMTDHARWLPEGPTPASPRGAPGNTATLTATLRRKDGGPLDRGAVNIRFELPRSSTEPGVCINFPVAAAPDPKDFDLRFVAGGDAKPIGAEAQAAETPLGDWRQATVVLGAFDWGAYGNVTAIATVPDYGDVLATVASTGAHSLPMPQRSSGSNIGDAWKEQFRVTDQADTDDTEKSPGNTNDGDGFTLYEEYRGLIARGQHSRRDADARLDPKKKNLVLLLAQRGRTATYGQGAAAQAYNLRPIGGNLPAALAGGRMLADAIGDAQVVPAWQDEAPATRRMNANSAYGLHKPQHGVILYDLNSNVAGDVGLAAPLERRNKTPLTCDFVAVDFASIASGHAAQAAANAAGGIRTPYTLAGELANTVAHELAHACGVAHHGDRESASPTRQLEATHVPPRYKVIGIDGTEVTAREHTVTNPDGTVTKKNYFELKGQIAGDDSRSSGDLTCLMCYPNYYTWRLTSIRNQGYVWRAMLPLPMGTTLCTARDGNPPNPHFGPAAAGRGNCRAKVKIRDEAN